MRVHCIASLAVLLVCASLVRGSEEQALEDDDFAEFEQFDADDADAAAAAAPPRKGDSQFVEDVKEAPAPKPKAPVAEQFDIGDQEEDIMVEDEDNEFDHFHDPEEFEGFADSVPRAPEQPKITIAKVPMSLQWRWDAYWLEGVLCCVLAAYALAFAVGRARNCAIAVDFLRRHRPLLEDNFTLVGEAGGDAVCPEADSASGSGRGWQREAEHCFTMWCSGRQGCEGMLLTLKLIKRQDLVHVVLGAVRPTADTLDIRVELSKEDSDPFVLCLAPRKAAARLAKEMHDLSVYCGAGRAGERFGLPSSLTVLAECAEAAAGLLDARAQAAIARLHPRLRYLHVSDQYCGPKQPEEQASTKPPETERVMMVSFALAGGAEGDEEVRPLLQLVFHLMDRLRRLRLSKEALAKCERRRQKVGEAWLRGAHAARQELAAQRREDRRKLEKEKILAEDDPEKQRRWELKEQKRQQKRKTPKMKQLKVKAL